MNIFCYIFLILLFIGCMWYLYYENITCQKAYKAFEAIINSDIENIKTTGDCDTILNYIKKNYPKFTANRNIQSSLSEKYWFVNGIRYYLMYLQNKNE